MSEKRPLAKDLALTWSSRSDTGHGGFLRADLAINFVELLRRESWILLEICGLFLIPDRRARALSLTLVGVTILVVARSFPPVGRSLHYLIHPFPLFALGLAVFMDRSASWVYQVLSDLANKLEKFRKFFISQAAAARVAARSPETAQGWEPAAPAARRRRIQTRSAAAVANIPPPAKIMRRKRQPEQF